MTEDIFGVPDEFKEALNHGMNQEGGIRLPFTAPLMWWINGKAQNRALATSSPSMYFGGWVVEEDMMDDAVLEYGELPYGFSKMDYITDKGDSIPTYSARAIVTVPMAYRMCWIPSTGGFGERYTKWREGLRMHVQFLTLIAVTTPEKRYKAWGPVILSAKGLQAGHLLDSFKEWKKLLQPVLRGIKSKTPENAFWLGLGSFGQSPETEMAGKNTKSPITPIRLYKPPQVDVELLKKLFVGQETVASMADYLAQAQEWLMAWQTPAAPQAEEELAGELSYSNDIPF